MSGSVTLVGAGPGPGLITVKGLQALRSAEVVVYDDLIDRELLSEAPRDCERVYVGKRFGAHSETQAAINALLIDRAKAGKTVVRLKGGDPFVLGRGGEELLALREAGIPYEAIPGVTSAVAVPEACGIPVTHRGMAQSFTVVTGHSAGNTQENYEALAGLGGTLVFLMGLHSIGMITARLMAHGKRPDTPAAVLSRGCWPEQTRIDGTLGDIAERAALAEAPAIFVVGQVAGLNLSKTIRPPLEGVSVAVTGTERFTKKLAEPLRALGAAVTRLPLLEIVPNPAAIPDDLGGYTWLAFTSSNGVDVFFAQMKHRGVDFRTLSHLKFACVGSGTAKRLQDHGFHADFVPSVYTAEALGRELATMLTAGDRLLLLRAENGSEALPETLIQAGMAFDDAPVYAARPMETPMQSIGADYIVFSSGSGVDAFFRQGGALCGARPVCIGNVTEERLRTYTDAPALVPNTHTTEAITNLILEDISHETI